LISIFLRFWRKSGPWVILLVGLGLVRFSKGALFLDFYSLVSRPFWPGTAQKEWIKAGVALETQAKLDLLEADNIRLRQILSIQNAAKPEVIPAPVISRNTKGWSQQIELGKGKIHDIAVGDVVSGPGGLLGIVQSVTPLTSRVQLLTSPGSRLGVWVPRIKKHGLLRGLGTNRPQLSLLDKNFEVKIGDLVSTSPASTLLPPNLPVGVIQVLDNKALPAPKALVQLIAVPEAVDWVQVQKP